MAIDYEDFWDEDEEETTPPNEDPKVTTDDDKSVTTDDDDEEEKEDKNKVAEKSSDAEEEEEDESDDKDKDEDPDDAADPETPEPSVIEKFLEQFDVFNGQIEFEDGNTGNINDFDSKTQLEIVNEIVKQKNAESLDSVYNKEEQELIASIRSNKPIEQVLNEMADEKVMKMQTQNELGTPVDYESMSTDEVFLNYLREQSPEATDEELQEDLDIAKSSRTYEKTAEVIKNSKITEQNQKFEEYENTQKEAKVNAFKEKAATIVNAARGIENIGGWKINDEEKNAVLGKLVEPDENGDSDFVKNVVNNPQKMFEAQWYLENGQKMFDQMNTYYKDQVKSQYEKGLKEGQAKKSTAPKVTGTRVPKTDDGKPEAKTSFSKPGTIDLDDLYG